jgi:hypothetical protein
MTILRLQFCGLSAREGFRLPSLSSMQEAIMAKGQAKSNKETRKPKAEKPKKQNASNPSTK